MTAHDEMNQKIVGLSRKDMKIEIYDKYVGLGNPLACPRCGEEYLHHCRIEAFNRQKEDSDHGLHVSVESQSIQVDASMEANPSSRRNGLAVLFSCENCSKASRMILIQSKGQTFVYWDGL